MPFAANPVPKAIAPAGHYLPEEDFNAALWRLPEARSAAMRLPRHTVGSAASVRWPADGGRITQLRSTPWEGATALFFEFRMNEPLQICLHPTDELLLTFFLAGDVRGRYCDEPARPLDFRIGHALLRTPNRRGGYHIHIPEGHSNAFVQFRLKQQALPKWLSAFGVRLAARELQQLTDADDGTILCNAAPTAPVADAISRLAQAPVRSPAAVPLFHARAMELLTLTLLDLQDLLRPRRSPCGGESPGASAVRLARTSVERDPAAGWTVASLAAAAHTTQARLQQAFREQEGLTAYQFVRRARLEAAARLLLQSDDAVEKVAAETGWSCHGRFGAAFRQRFGCTPSAYRERR